MQSWILSSAFLVCAQVAYCANTVVNGAPATPQKPVTDIIHGISITDNYRWLEDQKSAETRAWIAAQQAYTEAYFKPLPGREQVYRRMSQLMRVDSYELPTVRGNRQFFIRHPADKNQNQLCLREGPTGKNDVLVDANLLSSSGPVTVRLLDVSRDGSLLAYGIQEGGQDEITVHFLNIDTRQTLSEIMPKAIYLGVSFTSDRAGLYYSKKLPEGIRLYFHAMTADPASDKLIFGKGYGPQTFVEGYVTCDGRWLIVVASTGWGVKSDVYAMRLGRDETPKPVITGLDGEFLPDYFEDHMYVTTTWKAPNRRVFSLDLNLPEQANWKDIVPEQRDHIESASVFGGKLVVSYLHDVTSRAAIYNLDGKHESDLPLPVLGSVSDLRGEPNQDKMYFAFESFAFPETIYQYTFKTGSAAVWWKAAIPGSFDDFVVKQVWYESRDKTRIPMFIVHKKGLKLDGTARVLMTGYGGFDISYAPHFNNLAVYWLEQGGVFALPNLRGGGEFGETWHKAGMFEKKQNVFDDFEAAADYLTKNGYTRPSRLGILGGSNGGLLVGAAVTQRPDLFGAVICMNPLLDMVRFDRFKVAQWWVSEYGSAQDENQFRYLFKYSPYHHVEKGVKYPAVLFVTGDGDTRVDPLHARKMAALMQASTGSSNPILLKYDTSSGHSGGKPLDARIEDNTEFTLFLNRQLQ